MSSGSSAAEVATKARGQGKNSHTVSVEYSRIGDSAHFEFDGHRPNQYKLLSQDAPDGVKRVTLTIASIDEKSTQRLRALKTETVSIESVEHLSEIQTQIKFLVPKSADFFDYLTDRPNRLVLDFFPRINSDRASSAPENVKPKRVGKKSAEAKPSKTSERAPAGGDFILVAKEGPDGVKLVPELIPVSEKVASEPGFERGVFDGGDPEFKRFTVHDYEIRKDAKIDSVAQLRIPFPPLDLGFSQLDFILKNQPEYSIEPKDTEENKEAQLLLTLFKNKRPAVLLKTAADFLKKYPKSEYDEIVRSLMADTHYKLWQDERHYIEENKLKDVARLHDTDFEEAMGLYNNLIEKYPESPLNARTLLLVGFSYLERGDSLGAMKTFQKFVRMQPGSPHGGQVKISIARAYLALNRFDDALRELEDVVKAAPQEADRDEALFRMGDVHFQAGRYTEAVKAYESAITSRTEIAKRFPNAFYNLAESHFRLGHEIIAINAYRSFLQKFPEHPHGGYAMTRLGELIESLVGSDDSRVTGAFFESSFRYRSTPGADIARMRILAARIPDMKEREFKDAIREIDEIMMRQRDLPSIQEFKAITMTDAFTKRGAFDKAAEDLIRFYKENTQSRKLDLVKGRIVRNLIEAIKSAVDRDDFFDALKRFSKDEQGWLKNVSRADLPYLIGRAYETAGAPAAAKKEYSLVEERIALRKEGDREPFEMAISPSEVRLRIAKTLSDLGEYPEANQKLKSVEVGTLSSQQKWEYTQLAADLAEVRGDRPAAIAFLKDAVNHKDLKNQDRYRILHRLAQAQERAGELIDAEKTLQQALATVQQEGTNAEKADASNTARSQSEIAATREYRAKILIQLKQKEKAIEELRLAIEEAGTTQNGEPRSVRYLKGKLEFELGDLKAAQATWSQLEPGTQDLWSQLAREQMRSAEWDSEYKKYLKRIPASQSLQ